VNFQRNKRPHGLVVDEYGISGLVNARRHTRRDRREFTPRIPRHDHKDVHAEADGSYVANASATIRAINRSMRWNLPTMGRRPERLIWSSWRPSPNPARR